MSRTAPGKDLLMFSAMSSMIFSSFFCESRSSVDAYCAYGRRRSCTIISLPYQVWDEQRMRDSKAVSFSEMPDSRSILSQLTITVLSLSSCWSFSLRFTTSCESRSSRVRFTSNPIRPQRTLTRRPLKSTPMSPRRERCSRPSSREQQCRKCRAYSKRSKEMRSEQRSAQSSSIRTGSTRNTSVEGKTERKEKPIWVEGLLRFA
mmetsp:Transcript_68341/g.163115  ORF Transcript_68341/g.163115 Transcript_68341/m.163115 type:complete len:204 (-) Transcript_68341:1080-1691(-)